MTVRLERRYDSANQAERLRAALAADDPEFLRSGTDGPTLWITVEAPSAASARTTLEDAIACLQAAERTLALTSRGAKPSS